MDEADRARREKKTTGVREQEQWQDGAGGLLLQASAHETGLFEHLEAALEPHPCPSQAIVPGEPSHGSQAKSSPPPMRSRKVLRTLVFLGACGLRRTTDLRSYSGDALGLLSGRKQAYSYSHTERCLSSLAASAEHLTDALARWTARLWQESVHYFYVDGHRKPVYCKQLVPRGLIGRSGKILGCRALVLLHDEDGHPRSVITGRGDLHLTVGLPSIVTRYDQITGSQSHPLIIVDREGMSASFLKTLTTTGQAVATLLRANQYEGLQSFSKIGPFVPLDEDPEGTVLRDVAEACFVLPLPDSPGQTLPVRVALIRDFRRPPVPDPRGCSAPELIENCLACDWQAHPWPVCPTSPKVIPVVTTDQQIDAVELARAYTRRWPAQENIIRDFLLPLGLDTNHGYAKTPVVNSETVKKRETIQQQLNTAKKRITSARTNYYSAITKSEKLMKQIQKDEQLYHMLDTLQNNTNITCEASKQQPIQIKMEKDKLCAKQEKKQKRLRQATDQQGKALTQCNHYAQQQCHMLRYLEDLEIHERTMYELDNRKDQVMTVFKVAATNLIMWTRDQYFPDTYSSATWERLAPFFRLPGIIRSNRHIVSVSLRPFNDRQYNRDLDLLCQRVNQKQPHLPDGRLLQFFIHSPDHSHS